MNLTFDVSADDRLLVGRYMHAARRYDRHHISFSETKGGRLCVTCNSAETAMRYVRELANAGLYTLRSATVAKHEPLTLPLRMTRAELRTRVYAALQLQPDFASGANFHLAGWDVSKIAPTVMALAVGLGFVELEP